MVFDRRKHASNAKLWLGGFSTRLRSSSSATNRLKQYAYQKNMEREIAAVNEKNSRLKLALVAYHSVQKSGAPYRETLFIEV